jgi:hypothetical protein
LGVTILPPADLTETEARGGSTEEHEFDALRSKLADAVADLLLLIISRVRELKKGLQTFAAQASLEAFQKAVPVALEHTQLDSTVSFEWEPAQVFILLETLFTSPIIALTCQAFLFYRVSDRWRV